MQDQDFDAVESNSIHLCWWLCYNYRWYELICNWNCMRLQRHISLAWKKLISYVLAQFKGGYFWGWAFMSHRLSNYLTALRATRERSFSVGQSWVKRRWFCVMEKVFPARIVPLLDELLSSMTHFRSSDVSTCAVCLLFKQRSSTLTLNPTCNLLFVIIRKKDVLCVSLTSLCLWMPPHTSVLSRCPYVYTGGMFL